MLVHAVARRDKQEAEGRAAQAASDLQQEQQRSATELRRLQAAAEEEHTEAKVSSDERMEEYTGNFRSAHLFDKTIVCYPNCFILVMLASATSVRGKPSITFADLCSCLEPLPADCKAHVRCSLARISQVELNVLQGADTPAR